MGMEIVIQVLAWNRQNNVTGLIFEQQQKITTYSYISKTFEF
jgi:hypothetical protein